MQDGRLQLAELAPIFADIYPDDSRYSHMSAKVQMEKADKNNDNKLDLNEMTQAVHVFYGTVDPDPPQLALAWFVQT